LRNLATFALQKGKEDDDVWLPLSKDENRNPQDIFSDMVKLTREGKKSYNCTFTVTGTHDGLHSVVNKLKYKVVRASELSKEYLGQIDSTGKNCLHIQICVRSHSIRSAVAEARRRLSHCIGYVSLYTNPPALRIESKAFVTVGGLDQVFVQNEQAFRRLHRRTRAKSDISELVKHISKRRLDKRLLAAIEQLALASGSSDPRTRFITLWSAMETLAGAHEGETTMERVSNLVVPLVVSRHIHRTTRYLSIQIQKFSEEFNISNLGPGLSTRSGFVLQEDVLRTLTSPNCSPEMIGVLNAINHPLLRCRLFTTWKLFHCPKRLRNKLKGSEQRIGWQLARIYRARNALVHEGEEVKFIVPLLDNLQNYLSMVVQRIVHESKSHPNWTIRGILEFWKGRMQHAYRCLDECPQQLNTRDFLEKGSEFALWK
ncbi:MAG: hypothetical protein ACK5T6_10665, partial [Pirellula sp.]